MKLKDNVYDVLKWVAMIAIDAVATCFAVIAQAWQMDMAIVSPIVVTLTAVGTLLGALIGVSTAQHNKKQ